MFREEFGTVNIAMPRQSGHSTAALQLMYEYPDSVLFVPNGSSLECMRGLLRNYTDDTDIQRRINKNTMVPSGQAMANLKPVWARSFVIIDQATRMNSDAIHHVVTSLQASIVLKLG